MALPLPQPWSDPPRQPKRPVLRALLPPLTGREKRLVGALLVVATAATDGAMSFLEHLDELRKRLIVSVAALFVAIAVAFAFVSQIFDVMMQPLVETLPAGGTLIYTEPAEAFLLYIKMASLAGVSSPRPSFCGRSGCSWRPGCTRTRSGSRSPSSCCPPYAS